ncbi:MAG: hypothetical protein UT55_C0039G0003 [Candidatus Peregrinibacteria bacterium GW2011_GWE2_39_6]|nr:MAG: hypothetical protein UT36_C0006G0082 [Candidatus Peregrinibacteria bacterium GW2011_GWF2_39_17]KKR25532.1 MAG: hypothetical protein UT55_C0039G0003 [Candidatus Peregrinibacteria bacterium GW2011_GWE2_39_6]HCW32757.1 hypothetical protein [Candidatus Peregrinibacteria bacterium]
MRIKIQSEKQEKNQKIKGKKITLEMVHQSVGKVEQKLEKRMDGLEKRMDQADINFSNFYGEFCQFRKSTDQRFTQIDVQFIRTYKLIEKFRDEMMTRFDAMAASQEKHDQENTMRDYDLNRHEVMLKRINGKLVMPHLEAI